MLKITFDSSSEDICNTALPPFGMSLYSIAKDRPSEDRNGDTDFVTHALSAFEGVEPSKGPFIKYVVLILFQGMFWPYLVNLISFVIFG